MRGTYRELQPNEQGWLWSEQLELHLGIHEQKLRFFTGEGQLVPTPEEAVIAEQQRAEQAEALLARYRERFGEFSEE